MKKLFIFLTLIFFINKNFAQITKTSVANKKVEIDNSPYDSLRNFLDTDVRKYIGQEFYLLEKSESLREYGYRGFFNDYKDKKIGNSKNIYKCCQSHNSKYDDLAGRYFTVKNVFDHPDADQSEYLYGSKYYLELEDKENQDIVYYEYDSKYDHSFPFIVVGFFEKQKKDLVGKSFVVKNNLFRSSIDINTGEEVTNEPNQDWVCKDVTIEDKYYTFSLILENSKGELTTLSHNTAFGTYGKYTVFPLEDAKRYETKFGKENWLKILDSKVITGFSEEMVKLSWGEPDKINRSSYTDQWIYGDQYLYFENGKMKSFN